MQDAKPAVAFHEGRNMKRFAEMRGIKQDALAIELGNDWNQQKISLLEQKESIDLPLLQQFSAALNKPVEAIQNFDEEQAVNIIANTFGDNACVGNPNSTSAEWVRIINKCINDLAQTNTDSAIDWTPAQEVLTSVTLRRYF